MNLYNLIFRMVFLFPIRRYIYKMATDGGGGVVDGRARRFHAQYYFLFYGIYIKWPLTEEAGWWMAERDDFMRNIGPG